MLGFLSGPVAAAFHLVVAIAGFLSPLGPGLATVVAIVIVTASVRLLLSPLSFRAIRGQAQLAALQPRIAELRTRYAREPDRLQAELTAVYRTEGGGLIAGFLPLLLQLPFFSVLYRLFRSGTIDGHPNSLLTRDLLTTPLGAHWLAGAGPASTQGLLFLGLFALLAAVGYLSVRIVRAASQPSAPTATPARLSRFLSAALPYTTVLIAAFLPLAAGVYLLTTTAWTAAERTVASRRVSRPVARPGGAGLRPR